ncbi:MAG: Rieske 2Fe-2S domain-containing protein [Chloroflexi bacterium]|nr:Rieske 2Fe-2S domain-containing protein [Chloroflexota bacterium]MDA0242394.1 Rieske 2Fe-2S domain-containing protein [Chloroflexota bacterium]
MAVTTAEPVSGISRREFLYYIWGASIALYLAEVGGLIIWFAIPRIKEGTFGGVIRVEASRLPAVNAAPLNEANGRFWLVNLDTTTSEGVERMYQAGDESATTGVVALYKVCTHLGCIYPWNEATNRFECPCHGSKYRLDGRRIEAPAPRSLDRFPVTAYDAEGNVVTDAAGNRLISPSGDGGIGPLVITADVRDKITQFAVDTGTRTDGLVLTLLKDVTSSP